MMNLREMRNLFLTILAEHLSVELVVSRESRHDSHHRPHGQDPRTAQVSLIWSEIENVAEPVQNRHGAVVFPRFETATEPVQSRLGAVVFPRLATGHASAFPMLAICHASAF